jgi:hypothetical protein
LGLNSGVPTPLAPKGAACGISTASRQSEVFGAGRCCPTLERMENSMLHEHLGSLLDGKLKG